MIKNTKEELHFITNHWSNPFTMIKLCIAGLMLIFQPVVLGSDPEPVNEIVQQYTITGRVTDSSTGEALIGVSVVIPGTTTGALTDIDGKFSILIPQQQVTLQVSFIGYTTQEIQATANSPVNVAMVLAVTEISEVVVVGYGTQKKESVVGAISQVDGSSLVKAATPNITSALSGRLSGVLTIQTTGQPGSNDSEIIIRGLSSWSGSQPLVLVDGVERDFRSLDPEQINTISILKDASATAVFGAKGANGVIIVTTKRGSVGKPQLSFSTISGLSIPTEMPDHIRSYTTMSMLNVAYKNEGMYSELVSDQILEQYRNPSNRLNSLRYPDNNYYDLLMKDFATTTNESVSIRGGSDFVKYFFSLAHLYEGDYFKSSGKGYQNNGTRFNRYNYRSNLDFTLSKTTQLSLNLGGDYGIRRATRAAQWGNIYESSTARFPAYFPEWVLEEIPDNDYADASGSRLSDALGDWAGNPYTQMNSGGFQQNNDGRLYTDLALKQDLNFITEGLSFKGSVSLSTYFSFQSLSSTFTRPTYYIIWDRVGVDANGDGENDQNPWFRVGQGNEVYNLPLENLTVGGLSSNYYRDLYYEFSLNYNNTFFEKHAITALALMNRQEQNQGTAFPYYNEAWVGRFTYSYSSKYLLEINLGYTGSERFAPGNRFGFFPSGAIGWVISEEPFFNNSVPWMNKLKIRYSEGLVGSDYASSRWLYKSDYYLDSRGNIWEDSGANTFAQWEEARKRDIGIEIGIFKNLLSLNLDFFDEYRSKMLLTPRSVTFLVGNSFKDLNLGSVKKHGFEVELNFRHKTDRGLEYSFGGNFGFTENRIVNRDDLPYSPEYSKDAGKPLDSQVEGVELTGSGYMANVDDMHISPSPVTPNKMVLGDYQFLDFNGDGKITTLDKHPIEGLTYPPITYSFTPGLSYKGFSFNLMFQGNQGKWATYYGSYAIEFRRNVLRVNQANLDYWRPDNQDVLQPTLHYSGSSSAMLNWGGGESDQYSIRIKDIYWRESNYLRLKEIYAGYTINFRKQFAGISNVLVYATGRNVFTITKLLQGDPERKNFANGYYPIFATYSLGLRFSL